ncbi:MAG: DUF3047 domain-containing protein [Pseudomonadota bacterium]
MPAFDLLLILLWGGLGASPATFTAPPSDLVLENFETFVVGAVPSDGWTTRGGNAEGSYSIQQETGGNHYLKAVDRGRSVQLFKEKGWDLKTSPYLRWKWRANRFPVGSDERIGAKNDSAAGIYVVFPRRFFVPEAIKYVWSLNVPVGTQIARRDHFPIFVIRSGTSDQGHWVPEVRNVREDFISHFHRMPADPVAVGFLTDANETQSSAEADYDDLTALARSIGP